MKLSSLTLVLGVLVAAPAQLRATTHYVDINCATPTPPYTNWATAATNIQDATGIAGLNDLVLVTNGIYENGGIGSPATTTSNRVRVANSVTLQSVNGPAVTIIKGHQVPGTTNGVGAVRCVFLNEFCKLYGFTLTGGATITSSDTSGGGVLLLSQCVVSNCIITGNASTAFGGGAYSANNSLLVNCILNGNFASPANAGAGGGAAGCTLLNCVLAGNGCGYRGAAAYNCTLINCTVVSNTGPTDGLDLCKVRNSISYYNTPDNGESPGDGNQFTNCCIASIPFGSGNIITNPPLFANLAAGDFHLNAASPCINAGNNSFNTNTTDLDGNARVANGTVDIGAYEFQAGIHYVNISNPIPVSPFTSWANAATNIQDAIDAANAGDSIVVSNGTYNFGGRAVYGVATNRVVVDKALIVQSVNGPASTTIVGFGNRITPGIRCLYLTNNAAINGFTLSNGAARLSGDLVLEQAGGAVWCEDDSATISNCIVSGSFAANGQAGGVFRGRLFNCVLTNNIANYGGGAASNTLVNCVLTKNFAIFQNIDSGGGAIYSTLSNCVLVDNRCNGGGGGAGFSVLSGCVLSNNVGNSGGGGVCMGIADNCLISSNRTFNSGGGAYSNVLNNCILKNNLASGDGGGAYNSILLNCTVVSNTAFNGTQSALYGGGASNSIVYYNLNNNFNNSALSFCDTLPLAGGIGNITNEPSFVDLPGRDFHLQTNSPCINAGNNSFAPGTTDFDNNPRIAGGTVDIGAYEFQSPSSVLSYAWAQQFGLPTDGTADYADADGDGLNNWQEWRASTDPTNSLSVLQLLSPSNSVSGLTVTWQSVSGVTYYLDRSIDLGAQPMFTNVRSNILGQAGTTSYTDTNAIGDGPFFYRVGVQ